MLDKLKILLKFFYSYLAKEFSDIASGINMSLSSINDFLVYVNIMFPTFEYVTVLFVISIVFAAVFSSTCFFHTYVYDPWLKFSFYFKSKIKSASTQFSAIEFKKCFLFLKKWFK